MQVGDGEVVTLFEKAEFAQAWLASRRSFSAEGEYSSQELAYLLPVLQGLSGN